MSKLSYIKNYTDSKKTANEIVEIFKSRKIYCKHNKNRSDNTGGYIVSVLYNNKFYTYLINKSNCYCSTDYLINQIISNIL